MNKNPTLNSQPGEAKNKAPFKTVQPKNINTRKKVTTAVVATTMAIVAIAVPTVIKLNQNKSYTVTLQYGVHGQLGTDASYKLKKGSSVGDIKVPAKPGYFFMGFCSDAECTQTLDVNTKITENTTIYLHYVAINYSFANIPEGVSITTSAGEVTTSTKLNYGDEITVTYIIPVGHSVGNFKLTGVELISQQADVTEGNGDISRTATYKVVGNGTSAQAVTLTAEYEAVINQYTVTLISYNKTENIKVTYNNSLQNLADPTSYEDENNVYYFVGWNKNKNATETDVMENLSTAKITEDTTFYAIYRSQTKICDVEYKNQAAEHVIIYKLVNDIFVPLEVSDVIKAGDTIKVEYILTEGYVINNFTIISIEEQDVGENYIIGTAKLGETITIDFTEIPKVTDGLQFIETEGGYSVSGYIGTDNDICIPETFNNKPVLKIENRAFSSKSTIKNVYIPSSVTSIGNSIFHIFSEINSINFMGTLEQWCAINLSENLRYSSKLYIQGKEIKGDLVIPEGVTSIGNYVFSNCSKITNIMMPHTITNLGNYSFYGCSGLTDITIPNSVTNIGSSAFSGCSGLTDITIPNSVTNIGSYAFSGCSGLIDVTINSEYVYKNVTSTSNCGNLLQYVKNINVLKSIDDGSNSYLLGNNYKLYNNLKDYNTYSKAIYGIDEQGFMYSETTDGLSVVGYTGNNTTLRIPSMNNGLQVKSIANSAFQGLKITNVIIPETVVKIGSSAFADCKNLTDMNYLGTLARWSEINFGNSLSNPTYYTKKLIIKGEEVYGNIVIPEGVTSIGSCAFYNCIDLTGVTLPSSLTKIGSYAFENCIGLTDIAIPNNVTSIGEQAFSGCSGLTSVTIGESVNGIGSWAFAKCSGLTSITIPESVSYLSYGAFQNCTGLLTVTINSEKIYRNYATNSSDRGALLEYAKIVHVLDSVDDGSNTLLNSETYKVYQQMDGYKTYSLATYEVEEQGLMYKAVAGGLSVVGYIGNNSEVIIPSEYNGLKVVSIGNKAFCGSDITKVTIGEGVTSIESYAFRNCARLTSVTIPSTITNLGARAFDYCTALTLINFNAVACANLKNDSDVFNNAGTLGDGITVVFGETVEKIPENLFYSRIHYNDVYAPNITNVIIGSNVTKIGSSAFTYWSDSLTGMNYLGTLEQWSKIEFGSSTANPTYYTKKLIIQGKEIKGNLIIPESITNIMNSAFYNCVDLITVTLPSNLSNIGDSAFYGCTRLTNINIPEGVTTIGSYAFYECKSLININIPNGVTAVGEYAFAGCVSLTEITIPSSVTSINLASVFVNCRKLKKIYYAGTVLQWLSVDEGSYDKTNCYNKLYINGVKYNIAMADYLTGNIVLPEGLTKIGAYKFYNNINITGITIPSDVASLGNSAFYGCTHLTRIYFNAINCVNANRSNVFGKAGMAGDGVIVTFGTNVTSIPEYLFYSSYDAPKITRVVMSGNVTTIGRNAFNNCVYLTNIELPSSVTSIGDYAFRGCTGLTNLTIPENITTIGYRSFDDCTGLMEINFNATNCNSLPQTGAFENAGRAGTGITVNFGDGVTKIPGFLFYGIPSEPAFITSVIIGKNVTSIGSSAFSKCSSLTAIYFKGTQEEWKNISGVTYSIPSTAHVYFYTNTEGCIHEDDLWKLIDNKPITSTKTLIVDKEPTYEETGLGHWECSVCGESVGENVSIPKLANYTITNDATNPWTETEGLLTSGGKGVNNAVSTYTIAAGTKSITVTYEYKVSSEANYDKLTIKKGTEVLVNGISGNTNYVSQTVTLQAGEVLTFTYSKDGSANSGDDCAYIKGLTITVVE